jgi:transposase-like protein
MSDPFRYFNSPPKVIRLVVMMYVQYPLSLRIVEDFLAERRIDTGHVTLRTAAKDGPKNCSDKCQRMRPNGRQARSSHSILSEFTMSGTCATVSGLAAASDHRGFNDE